MLNNKKTAETGKTGGASLPASRASKSLPLPSLPARHSCPWIITLFAITLAASLTTYAAATPLVYQNRPIVTLVHPLESLPLVPFAIDFETAQQIGREVFFVPISHNQQRKVLLSNAGGLVQTVHFPRDSDGFPVATADPISGPFIHQGTGNTFAFVTHSPQKGPRMFQRSSDGSIRTLDLPPSIPGFPDLAFDEILQPICVGDMIVFYGRSARTSHPFAEGIYQWQDDQLTIIVDSRLVSFGDPHFDFDGERIAFLATAGTPTLFSYHPQSGITPLLREHTTLPSESVRIQSLLGRPNLKGASTIIKTSLSSDETILLSTTGLHQRILVRPGMSLPDSDQIAMIGTADPITAGDQIYFEAQTTQGRQGIFVWNRSTITPVVDTTTPLVSDTPPTAIQLLDADEQSIVFKATTDNLVSLHASLSSPDIPVIHDAPTEPLIASPNSTISLTTQFVGLPPLTYQWSHNGTLIPEAKRPTLTIDNLNANDAGTYHFTVSNANGSTSTSIELEIATAPIIGETPAEINLFAGAPLQIPVPIQGNPPLSIQWFKDSQTLPSQTLKSLWISNVSASDAGTYTVEVSNDLGSATSPPIQVNVAIPPPNPQFEHGPFHQIAALNSPLANQPQPDRLSSFQSFPAGEAVMVTATLESAPEINQLWFIQPSGISRLQFTTADLTAALPHAFDNIRQPLFNVDSQSIVFAGTVNEVPIGIYEFHQNQFHVLAQPSSPVPDAPLQSYRAFRSEHTHYGNTLFTATLNRTDTRGIYQVDDRSVSIIANESTSLPEGFGTGSEVEFLASNGYQHLFQKQTTTAPPDFGLFLRQSDGDIQLLHRHDQPIVDTPFRFHSAIVAEATNERFIILVRTTDFDALIAEFRQNTLRALITPGMPISNGTTLSQITSDRPHFEMDRIYFTATLSPNPMTPNRARPYPAIVYWDDDGLHPAMTAEWLSGQRYTDLHLVHAYDRTLFFTARLQRQGKTLYANQVPPRPIRAHIEFRKQDDHLTLNYPEGFQLETSTTVEPPRWEPLEAISGIRVPSNQANAFFRVRKND